MKKQVTCFQCEETFNKTVYEIEKSKSGRHFCSRKCASKYATEQRYGKSVGFGYYTNSTRKRAKRQDLEFNLTPEYLKELYENQNGLCAITGIQIILNSNTRLEKDLSLASVDRIDNSLGYVKGNIHFTCLGFNYMRNSTSLEHAVSFLNKIMEG